MKGPDFWDREVSVCAIHASNWMQDATVRDYINASIGAPDEPRWPFDWLVEQLGGRTFRRALSIGCGTGALERDLIRRELCERVDAFDGSIASLAIAAREADAAGFSARIRYFASDFNRPAFPNATYDLVLAHQAMHHVGKLEKLFAAVLRTLRPDGLFYMDEYIGPSRHEWSAGRFAEQRNAFATIPREHRLIDELPYPIVEQDPSEAIRSGEIMAQLLIGFDTVAVRPYGGNLLAPIYPAVDWTTAPKSLLQELISREKAIIQKGSSFHSVVLARPKGQPAKRVALLRYFTEPKAKRIVWEIKHRLPFPARNLPHR